MCGISGVLNFDGEPVPPLLVERMSDLLAHRGPDGSGQWTKGPVGFGHRRLAILDLSPAGHQPMLTRDGRFALTYNGEIYNFRELRAELESLGFMFHSDTDSEVVLNALAAWGTSAIPRFNGMFAFALWDERERSLLLARDRYGIKPLYYAVTGSSLLFASEQKAFKAQPAFAPALDHSALYEYLTFQNLFTDRTLLQGVRLLPPGHWAISRADQPIRAPEQTCYWEFDFREPDSPAETREYEEELERLFRQAVNRQLISDVELGAYLSGGMDSGSITAVAAASYPNMKTFTCGFDLSSASGLELAYDERVRAEAMSAVFKTEHYEMVLKAGDMERCLPSLAWHLEEPRVGQSYPNYYAAGLASRFVKVVLSGAGGDELFGGYPWRYFTAPAGTDFDGYVRSYFEYWQRLLDEDTLIRLTSPGKRFRDDIRPLDIFTSVFKDHHREARRPEDFVNLSLFFEARTFLHGLLVVEDKLSMAHGLETRLPFLDNDLVDFALTCPAGLKVHKLRDRVRIDENSPGNKSELYYEKTHDGKFLLREVMGRLIPEETARTPKQGFSAPDASWFRGESIDFVERMLLNRDSRISDVLDPHVVSDLVGQHLRGESNRRLLIWSFLNLEQWLRTDW